MSNSNVVLVCVALAVYCSSAAYARLQLPSTSCLMRTVLWVSLLVEPYIGLFLSFNSNEYNFNILADVWLSVESA